MTETMILIVNHDIIKCAICGSTMDSTQTEMFKMFKCEKCGEESLALVKPNGELFTIRDLIPRTVDHPPNASGIELDDNGKIVSRWSTLGREG